MGMWNDFVGWLTGRDMEAESAIHENPDAVDSAVDKLTQVSTTTLGDGKTAVQEALKNLNNVTGFNDYVTTIDPSAYDSLFDSLTGTVDAISGKMTGAVDDIEAYQNSGIGEKILGSIGMAACKFGEGLVSVGEDLVDGVVSIGGFISAGLVDIGGKIAGVDGAGDGIRDAVGGFVKTDFSHDLFAGAENYLDKYSVFTQDSALGQGFEIGGKVVGYLYAGGLISGLGKGLGLGAKGLTSSMLNVASGTTWGATVAGFVGGTGHGTESGLIEGKSFNEAFVKNGLTSGVIQGGLAFGFGKAAEHFAGRGDAIRTAKEQISNGEKALEAANQAKEAAKNLPAGNAQIQALKAAKTARLTAEADIAAGKTALETAKHAAGFQGYQDAITKAGARAGEAQGALLKSTAQEISSKVKAMSADKAFAKADKAVSDLRAAGNTHSKEWLDATQARAAASREVTAANNALQNAKDARNVAIHGARDSSGNFLTDSAGNVINRGVLRENVLVQGAQGAKSALSGGGKAVWNTLRHPINTAKSAASSVKNAASSVGNAWTSGTPLLGKTGAAASVLGKATAVAGLAPTAGIVLGSTYNQSVEPTSMQRFDYGLQSNLNEGVKGVPNPKPEYVDPNDITYSGDPAGKSDTSSQDPTVTTDDTPTPTPSTSGEQSPYSGDPGASYSGGDPGSSSSGDSGTPQVPETIAPQTEAPQTSAPQTEAPRTEAPRTEAPRTEAPRTEAPQTSAPQTMPPETVPITVPPSTEAPPIVPTPTTDAGGAITGGGGTSVSGGSYGEDGFTPSGETGSNELEGAENLLELDESDSDLDSDFDTDSALDNIINSSKYTKVPTSTTSTSKKNGSSSVIPIAAGLSVAAAAGIGAKAYLDRKNNNEFDDEEGEEYDEEYEDDNFESDDWSEDQEAGFQPDFSDPSQNDLSDEYYQDNGGSYSAKSSEELADLQ